MKLMKLMVGILFMLSFAACNNDDDNVGGGDLVGTWKLVEYNYTGTSSTTLLGQTTTYTFEGVGSDFNNPLLVLTENPNNYTTSGSYKITLTTDTGSGEIETEQNITNNETGTWVEDGNKLITNSSTAVTPVEGEIVTLNNTTLKLKIVAIVNQSPSPGVTQNATTTINQTFTRQ